MKLTIIAATGGVGRQLLRQAPDAGHDVTAVARNPANLPQDVLAGRAVRSVAADLAAPDPQVLQDAADPSFWRCCPTCSARNRAVAATCGSGCLAALARDHQGAVAALDAHCLDVGARGL